MTAPKIKVLIVDDHVVVRNGIKYSLQSFDNIALVGEAGSGEESLLLCAQLQPDVVLMDLKMEGMDGIAATRLIRQNHPAIQVIILTSFHDKDLIEEALQVGAIGYLLKNVSVPALGQAIRAAYTGQSSYAPQVTQALLEPTVPMTTPNIALTERQQEVLLLMVEGLSNIEIAHHLDITKHTARYHVSAILSKFSAANRAEAVALALKYGLTSD